MVSVVERREPVPPVGLARAGLAGGTGAPCRSGVGPSGWLAACWGRAGTLRFGVRVGAGWQRGTAVGARPAGSAGLIRVPGLLLGRLAGLGGDERVEGLARLGGRPAATADDHDRRQSTNDAGTDEW